MKLKLIIFTLLFPFFLSGQNVTFESVFQTVDRVDTVEIYHAKLEIKVRHDVIEIYSVHENSKLLAFNFPVSMIKQGTMYYCTDENGSTVSFDTISNKLSIKNSYMVWSIYDEIPLVVKFEK